MRHLTPPPHLSQTVGAMGVATAFIETNAVWRCAEDQLARCVVLGCYQAWGGGEKLKNLRNKKSPKSTLLADNTRGLRTTKQTKPTPVAFAASHPITPASKMKEILMKNIGEKVLITNRMIWKYKKKKTTTKQQQQKINNKIIIKKKQ